MEDGTARRRSTLDDEYAAALGRVVFDAERLRSHLELSVGILINNAVAGMILKGQSADRLAKWGNELAQRMLPSPWPEEFKTLTIEVQRVLRRRNHVVHGRWQWDDWVTPPTVGRGADVQVMPLDSLLDLRQEIANVATDLSMWTYNWSRARQGISWGAERVGDAPPDGGAEVHQRSLPRFDSSAFDAITGRGSRKRRPPPA